MRKKWILTSLLAVIILPIILIVAVLIFLANADLTQHRDFIAESISKITGRGLSLNGEIELNLSSTPSIVVTDIVLANASWASEPEMLSVHRIAASIELSPLLHGDIHIPTFQLEDVKVLLETSASGLNNWELAEPVDADVAAENTTTFDILKLPWIGELSIGDVVFHYRDAQTGKEISAKLDHARLDVADLLSPTFIDIVGQVNNRPVEMKAQLALPSVFTTDTLDIPIELHVKALGLVAKATGTIAGSTQAPAIDLGLHASAADLKPLRKVFGDVVPLVKSVELDMTVKADQGQPVLFKLNAAAGKAKLVTELTLLRQAAAPNLTGKVELQDFDVVSLWAPLLKEKSASKTAVTKTPASAKTSVQKLDQVISLDWLQAFDANVLLSAKNINLPQVRIKSLHSRFIIDQRILKISKLKLVTDAGTVTAGLIVDAKAKQPAVSLNLNTTTLALARLQPLAANKRFAHSKVEAAISLTAKGDTVGRLIENLQGSVQLDYNDQKRKEKLAINLQSRPEAKVSGASLLEVTADGLIEEQVIELRGHITSPTGLLVSLNPYKIDLLIKAFGVTGKMVGKVEDPLSLNDGLDLAIEAHAADLEGLRRAFGEAVPALGKLDLSTSLSYRQSKIQLSKLAVVFEQGRVDGELVLDTATVVPDLQVDITFTDLNLDKLLPALEKPAKSKDTTPKLSKKSAAKKSPTKKAAKDKIFSDEPLPFDYLSRANVRMTLRAVNLIKNNKSLAEAEIKMDLQKGRLSVSLLKHSAFHGRLDSDFVIDSSGKGAPTVKIKFKSPRLEFGELTVISDGSSAVEGPLAIDISLLGQGNSLAQIMATLNGDVHLLMEKGSADAKALDVLVGGLTAILGTIFVEQSSKTQINCAICDLKFDDGILTPQLVVLDTQYSTVSANGQVDLKKEQLDIKVTPQAKGVTLSVAYPVHLYGQLKKPGIEIEKTDALLKTGELWANIVYPPSALIKFSDLTGGSKNPCISMVAEKAGIPILGDVGKAVGGVVKGVGGVVGGTVKGIGSGLGKIFGADKEPESKEKDSEVPTK